MGTVQFRKTNYTFKQVDSIEGTDVFWSIFHSGKLMIAICSYSLSQIPITTQSESLYKSKWYYIQSNYPEEFAGPPQVHVVAKSNSENIIIPRLCQEGTKQWYGALQFFSNEAITKDLNIWVFCVGTNTVG